MKKPPTEWVAASATIIAIESAICFIDMLASLMP
jgi:hypothetical protein